MNKLCHEIGNCKPKRKASPQLSIPELTEKQLRNFWRKVDRSGPMPDQNNPHYAGLDRCWVWLACKNKEGYGGVKIGGSMLKSHRVSKNLSQPFDQSQQALHICDNPSCINPDHIFLGNIRANHCDKEVKLRGNQPKGSNHGKSKLTETDIPEIRKLILTGMTQKEIGRKFGVSQILISNVLTNKNWKHVK